MRTRINGTGMDVRNIDTAAIDHVSLHEYNRACNGFDARALHRRDKPRLIGVPVNPTTSVISTDDGFATPNVSSSRTRRKGCWGRQNV
ncbi:hypothetical protein [Pandoraea sputorum]|uniref:hypothetical protein n=1 Tax=Pandoraea sputorum TaxID=93222 RepID=UPI0012534604|nr:hypothetical protein [Pandoraea sputorum]VVE56300.1 hypothetical protein PSP20601_05057 [Pandoraea sputorum]